MPDARDDVGVTVRDNIFKQRLAAGRQQYGLWLAMANAYTADVCAGAGYDFLVIDGEHAPNDLRTILAQLQVLVGRCQPLLRLPAGETWMIKQALDIGARSLLIPMVETAEQAANLVRAVRYPPAGIRGVGAALARASDFGRDGGYLHSANEDICLIVQAESTKAIENIDPIASIDGVDGVFLGPSDLAADMGKLGEPNAPAVRSMVEDAILSIRRLGKGAGVISPVPAVACKYRDAGATFLAVGSDIGLFVSALAQGLQPFQPGASATDRASGY